MQKLNNLEVEPVINKNFKDKISIHENLINNAPFFLSLIIGRKGSGKTSLLYSLLKLMCVRKKTKVIIISSTYNLDYTMIEIIRKLEKNNIELETYDNIYDENKKNILENITEDIKLNIDNWKEELKKSKKLYSKIIIVIDDLAEVLKNNILQKLVFKMRHFMISIILITQHYKSLSVGIRNNANILFLYSDLSDNVLEAIYDEQINSYKLPYKDFLNYYLQITEKKYNFMMLNYNDKDIRKNLNYKLII